VQLFIYPTRGSKDKERTRKHDIRQTDRQTTELKTMSPHFMGGDIMMLPVKGYAHVFRYHIQRVQMKRHRLWFSTKSCSCYSTKTYVNSVILILNLTLMRNTHLKWSSLSTTYLLMYRLFIKVKFNMRMRITLIT